MFAALGVLGGVGVVGSLAYLMGEDDDAAMVPVFMDEFVFDEVENTSYFSKIVGQPITPHSLIDVNNKNFFKMLGKKTGAKTVILYYWSQCGACKRFRPYWNTLVQVFQNTNVNFIAVERAQMSVFFKNKGIGGGSVSQFPTMRVVEGGKNIASFNNDTVPNISERVASQIASKYGNIVFENQLEDDQLPKLYMMIRFVDEAIN